MLTEPYKSFITTVWHVTDSNRNLDETIAEATSLIRHLRTRVADVERVNRNLQEAKEAERCFKYLKKFFGGGE